MKKIGEDDGLFASADSYVDYSDQYKQIQTKLKFNNQENT